MIKVNLRILCGEQGVDSPHLNLIILSLDEENPHLEKTCRI
jgi:hypothetical protein